MSILRGSKEFKIILVKLFNDILDYEESVLRASEFKDLTNNDIHVIRAIGMNEKKNMSMIAKELAVTIGTLTISINSLVRKGYVIKERSEKDQMVNSMLEDLEDNEMDILMKSLLKVNRCIKQNKA